MLLVSMSVTLDGFIADRDGSFGWGVPSDELFAFHTERVGSLGATVLGRRLFDMMLPWENDPAFRATEAHREFADIWCALPKVVFSRTLESVPGKARLATGSVADEVAAAVASTDRDVEIGGADLAGQALQLGLVDELRIFRHPVIVGGGKPLLPPVTENIAVDLLETATFPGGVLYERYQVLKGTAPAHK